MEPLYEHEYDDEESWHRASRRKRFGLIAFVAAAVLAFAVGIGAVVYAFTGSSDAPSKTSADRYADADAAAGVTSATPGSPSFDASTAASPTAVPSSASPSPSKKAKPKAKVPVVAPKETKVPPAPPKPAPSGCKGHYDGTKPPPGARSGPAPRR
jgi:hypothetical protein